MSLNPTLNKLYSQMTLPVICAPMYTISNPDFALEFCKNGVIGSLQALNAKTSAELDKQLGFMNDSLERMRADNPDQKIAPYAVNLIVQKEYAANLIKNKSDAATRAANTDMKSRLETDLDLCIKHQVPIIITSMGAVKELVDAVHEYGGLVFHDVTNPVHAKKAAAAGVDGIIAVGAGAGGNAGTMSPFALMSSIREHFNGIVVLGGAINKGSDILAAQAMDADFAYMGTRMIATKESPATPEYKQEILDAQTKDIVYTNAVTGVPCNFMAGSLKNAGYNVVLPRPDGSVPAKIEVSALEKYGRIAEHFARKAAKAIGISLPRSENEQRWTGIKSAGQGAHNIHDVLSVKDLIERMEDEYTDAKNRVNSLDFPAL